jgi:16S rRNA (guanine966-N2)-methyltransferase
MQMVVAAIFDSLRNVIPNARVLDLFAGTGALGIEALSRGAAHAVFVENDRRGAETIQRNLDHTALAPKSAGVHPMDVFSYLDRFATPEAFDLIFADPPYRKQPGERDFTPELLASDSLHRALAADGIFILEHLPNAELDLKNRWECIRQKKYGATAVALLRKLDAHHG